MGVPEKIELHMSRLFLFALVASSAAAFKLIDASQRPLIDENLVKDINADHQRTWNATTEVPKFQHWTMAQAKAFMACGRTDGLENLPTIQHDEATLQATPSSFDPRVSRKECTGPVLDQGFCGSCWAFGATEAISDRLCMSTGSSKFVQLAPLDLTACDHSFFSMENGCQGGQLGGAWNYAKKTGLVTEKCLPYLKSEGGPVPTCDPTAQPCLPESKFIKTPRCPKKCVDGSDWSGNKHKLKNVYSVPASQLMAELVKNGPVESAFTVFSDFVHYKSGVYEHKTGSMLGGHAIKIIGYGTESGTDYWLVQNSWTTTWGDGGYFKIKRGDDECGIEDNFIAGTF